MPDQPTNSNTDSAMSEWISNSGELENIMAGIDDEPDFDDDDEGDGDWVEYTDRDIAIDAASQLIEVLEALCPDESPQGCRQRLIQAMACLAPDLDSQLRDDAVRLALTLLPEEQ